MLRVSGAAVFPFGRVDAVVRGIQRDGAVVYSHRQAFQTFIAVGNVDGASVNDQGTVCMDPVVSGIYRQVPVGNRNIIACVQSVFTRGKGQVSADDGDIAFADDGMQIILSVDRKITLPVDGQIAFDINCCVDLTVVFVLALSGDGVDGSLFQGQDDLFGLFPENSRCTVTGNIRIFQDQLYRVRLLRFYPDASGKGPGQYINSPVLDSNQSVLDADLADGGVFDGCLAAG